MATNYAFPLPKYLEDAFQFMEANTPKNSPDLLKNLGSYQGELWSKQGTPHFKGWMGTVDGVTRYSADMGVYPEDTSKISYVGMWVGRTALNFIYCVLPSMNHGVALAGQTIEMGDGRIFPGEQTEDDLDTLVIRGWEVMNDIIEKRGRFVA